MAELAPWLIDSRPDLWVRAGVFAKIINRSPQRVHQMLRDGSVESFGYRVYRDQLGNWHIRISEIELTLVRRIKSVKPRNSSKAS
jgi:hypothetical protein